MSKPRLVSPKLRSISLYISEPMLLLIPIWALNSADSILIQIVSRAKRRRLHRIIPLVVGITAQLIFDLEATMFGKDFAAGVVLAALESSARLSAAIDTTEGVRNDSTAFAGVSFDLGAGAEFNIFACKKSSSLDLENLLHEVKLFSTSIDLFSTCLIARTGAPLSVPPQNRASPDCTSITVKCQKNISQATAFPFQGGIAQI